MYCDWNFILIDWTTTENANAKQEKKGEKLKLVTVIIFSVLTNSN